MLSHERVWAAIDALAERYSLSASGLARRAGLDSTAFNKSKRLSADGRPRWPSTESMAKIIEATGAVARRIPGLVEGRPAPASACRRSALRAAAWLCAGRRRRLLRRCRLSGRAGLGSGRTAGAGADDGSYALQVQGDSMLPLYRDGDVLIVEPSAATRKGDRVVVKTNAGEVMAKVLDRQTTRSIVLVSLNPAHPDATFRRMISNG